MERRLSTTRWMSHRLRQRRRHRALVASQWWRWRCPQRQRRLTEPLSAKITRMAKSLSETDPLTAALGMLGVALTGAVGLVLLPA